MHSSHRTTTSSPRAEGGDANAVLQKLGAVHMPISCAASVQVPFERGIALLHSSGM
jgi:hypothetical protein